MRKNFEFALSEVLKFEGGYVNDPRDPGGITNMGITAKTYAEFTGRRLSTITENEMRSLSIVTVGNIYKRKYWDYCKCDILPDGIDYLVFDYSVNSGPGRAIKHLQECLAIEADGLIGPDTLRHLGDRPVEELIVEYSKRRLDFLQDLPTFKVYGKGWTTRVNKAKLNALVLRVDTLQINLSKLEPSKIDDETRARALAFVNH